MVFVLAQFILFMSLRVAMCERGGLCASNFFRWQPVSCIFEKLNLWPSVASSQWTSGPNKVSCSAKNIARFPCFSGKFLHHGKYASVKDLTNILSVYVEMLHNVHMKGSKIHSLGFSKSLLTVETAETVKPY